MKSKLIVVSLLVALLVGTLAPSVAGRASAAVPLAPTASSVASHAAFLDKTRFFAHAGIAFFAIHHEYKRYKAGYFASGAPHRATNIIKAAAVLLIAYHEAKVAYGIAQKSNSKTLHALTSPFNALVTSIDTVRGRFAKGQFKSSDLESLNNSTTSINSMSSGNGVGTIHDISTPLPSGS